jgi:hypothetical protein
MEWHYLQIYFGAERLDDEAQARQLSYCDELLTDWLPDCVAVGRSRGWLAQYFFLRHIEGGYHLRLRLRGHPEPLRRHLLPCVERALVNFFKAHAALLPDGAPPADISALEEVGLVRRAPYEPEFVKYGGHEGVAVAEEHFEVSSELAVKVLEAERRTGVARAGAALGMIHSLLSAYSPSPAEQAFILKSHTDYWLSKGSPEARAHMLGVFEGNYARQRPRLARLFGRPPEGAPELTGGDDARETSLRWREHLCEHFRRLKEMDAAGRLGPTTTNGTGSGALDLASLSNIARTPTVGLRIVPNYLHLLCNRLGLTIVHELQLTHMLYRHLEERLGGVSASCPLVLEPRGIA